LQCGDPFGGVGEHETGLSQGKLHSYGVEVTLILLDFDGDCRDVIIELVIMCDFLEPGPSHRCQPLPAARSGNPR
jgi:hypothetical protein